MAIGGKTLGIVSGLAVGLTSGVILAALNPIIPSPKTDAQTSPVEQLTSAEEAEPASEPSLPKLSMVETTPDPEDVPQVETATTDVVQPDQQETETALQPELSQEPTQSGQLDPLDPVTEPETQLALVLPENAVSSDLGSAPDQPASAETDAQPTVSNTPAQAIDLAEPDLETTSPDVNQTAPVANETVEIASVEAPELAAEPSSPSPNETVVAALPIIQDPEAPKPAVAVIEEDTELKVQPNTSGTFKTSGGSIITKGSSLPKIGDTSETGLASIGTGQKSSRFKTIGDSAKITDVDQPQETTTEVAADVGALVRNAVEFPVTDDPLFSVILIDDGKIANQLPSIQGLNLPLSIAVSLDDADAAERAAKYRDAGFEVVAMAPRNVKLSLSGGLSNAQVAELLTEYFEILPMSVGLIDRPSANLQKDQRLARSVIKHFAETGHGLITYAGGLNGTKRVADQENVSNGSVFRFVDKSGEAGQIVTQQLDRAAREARKSGSVIVMATASKATLGSLVSWSLSSNARAVKIAPVSASLLKD